ncbi:MAG TPA: LexA family transcriptional regulator [Cytophagaceae bacterium]
MSLVNGNIKVLRKKLGLTQEQFAEKIGIKRSLLGAYEEGRAEPGLNTLVTMGKLFGVSVDDLATLDFTQGVEVPAFQKDVEARRLRVLSITVDKEDNEQIQLVPQKAAAGYLNGYSDPEFVKELPSFHMPMFKNGTYRAFEIKGDSMLPIHSGSVIIGQYVENWLDIKDDKTYVLITHREGIVYKRVFNEVKSRGVLRLVSDNQVYSPYDVSVDDIAEVWEAKAFISTEFPRPEMSIEKLTGMVLELQQELLRLKKE